MAKTAPTGKRASIHTLGCRLNQAESALLEEYLAAAGYTLVPFGAPASLGIVHTCTVTREADAKSRKLIRQFIRKNPRAFVAAIGCYAQTAAEELARIPGLDLVLGNREKLHLLQYVAAGKNETAQVVCGPIPRTDFTIDSPPAATMLTRRSNLKVQDGCDFMCSYCVIPFARGRSRSRALENLLDEARRLLERGAREIVLTGVNIGCYAHEGTGILELADRLAGVLTGSGLPQPNRLRISSIEPTTIPEALLERMGDPGHPLAPHLHIPLQSGSNRVLGAMKRRYTREEFQAFIQQARETVPGIGIGTDVLVGFPGETDADVEATRALLEEGPIDYAHVFKYSERNGTASARDSGQVDPRAIGRRAALLRRVAARKRQRFAEGPLGKQVDVLFETRENGYWSGYAGNYLRVAARSGNDWTNRFGRVVLDEASGGVAYGRLFEPAADPASEEAP